MPIYEYKCNQCGSINEILHKSLNIKAVICPDCHSTDLNKLISVPGAVMSKSSPANDTLPSCHNPAQCGEQCCPSDHLCHK